MSISIFCAKYVCQHDLFQQRRIFADFKPGIWKASRTLTTRSFYNPLGFFKVYFLTLQIEKSKHSVNSVTPLKAQPKYSIYRTCSNFDANELFFLRRGSSSVTVGCGIAQTAAQPS
jgi:hypothetical protein